MQGDSGINSLVTQIRLDLSRPASGFSTEDIFSLPSQLGFSLDREGNLSFDAGTFDEAVKEDYEAVLSVIGSRGTGVTSDANFQFSSVLDSTQAGQYDVKATFDASGNLTSAQIKGIDEDDDAWREAGIDVANGTITGKSGGEQGLLIKVVSPTASSTVEFVTNVRRGFAGGLFDRVEEMLATDGAFAAKENQYSMAIDQLEKQIERQEDRMETKEERLRAKYARLEATLASMDQMRSQVDALVQSLGTMSKSGATKK